MEVGKRVSLLAGSPSMASTWTDGQAMTDEAAEAVTEEVAAHSTRALLNTETQRQLTEHRAPPGELLCEPDSSLYSASTTVAV